MSDRTVELLARQLRLRDDDILPLRHVLRISLRKLYIDSQRVRLRQREERTAGAAACIDQIAHIHVALRHHARERSDDPLERFKLLQALYVGVRCCKIRDVLAVGALAFIEFLLRNGIALAQLLPALERALREHET